MQKRLINAYFPTMRRIKQKTNAHCGPAVLEMLHSYLGHTIGQHRFVSAASAKHKLKRHGMTIPDLLVATETLAPTTQFWYKPDATIADIETLVIEHKQPVGVEWQGVFGKFSDGDDGHYSIVTHIDSKKDVIVLSDPYRRFAGHDRTFTVTEFEKRWWDFNVVMDFEKSKKKIVKDHHVLFIVTDKTATFPKKLKMLTR
jgi:ABC-type bacteriocin/lantibiotic exporter with double-glycine peptidase domain